MYRRKVALTVSALAAGAEEDLTITETSYSKAQKGDAVIVHALNAPETGLVILHAWVDSPGVIKVRVGNVHTLSLAGGSTQFVYAVVR
jgi:hypothetical protein